VLEEIDQNFSMIRPTANYKPTCYIYPREKIKKFTTINEDCKDRSLSTSTLILTDSNPHCCWYFITILGMRFCTLYNLLLPQKISLKILCWITPQPFWVWPHDWPHPLLNTTHFITTLLLVFYNHHHHKESIHYSLLWRGTKRKV